MASPYRVFFWMLLLFGLFGLLIGMLNILNPAAVHIPFGQNGESAEGIDGLIASTVSSLVLGGFFGSAAAGLTWLVGRAVDKRN